MSNKRTSMETSRGGGGPGYSIFYKDQTANAAVPKEVLFFQNWGLSREETSWKSIVEHDADEVTEADLYDLRNVCGKYSWLRSKLNANLLHESAESNTYTEALREHLYKELDVSMTLQRLKTGLQNKAKRVASPHVEWGSPEATPKEKPVKKKSENTPAAPAYQQLPVQPNTLYLIINLHTKEITGYEREQGLAEGRAEGAALSNNCPHAVAQVVAYHGGRRNSCVHDTLSGILDSLRARGL